MITVILVTVLILIITIILALITNFNKIKEVKMQSDDARYLKKKIKSGAIDVHPTEKALVVNYELEAVILGEMGDPMHGDKRECQKIIRLKNLNAKTDCAALAKDVIEKCSIIHPSKIDEVERLIYYLKTRKRDGKSLNDMNTSQSSRPASSINSTSNNASVASVNNIDEYVDMLYEDISHKLKGSMYILEIAKNPDNLEELSKNEAAISALTRVLREEWRKSIDLSINIVCTLFFFSNYEEFHSVIIEYKIGSLCMFLIEQELQRYDQWQEELEGLNQDKDIMSMSSTEVKKSKIPEPTLRRPRSGLWSINDSSALLQRAKTAGISNNSRENSIDDLYEINNKTNMTNIDTEKSKKQLALLMKKQEQFLRVLFYLLLNIAEDVKIEEKMARKNIVEMLVKTLDRDNVELLTLCVTFLKKLSIRACNKDEMDRLNCVSKLLHLLNFPDAELVHVTLKLLFNLTFDKKLRPKLLNIGLLPKLVTLLSDDKHQNIVLKLLYQFSRDRPARPMFMYTDCVQLVTDMVLLSRDSMVDIELIALCINLSKDEENVEQMIEKNLVPDLIARALKYKDPLLMKMLRNISRHSFAKENFLEFVGEIAECIADNKSIDFSIECLGILGNLNLPDIDFLQIFQRLNLVPWIRKTLNADETEDDLILDIIIMLGTAVQDSGCAKLVCDEGLLTQIVELLNAKQVDDEIVLQIVYIFYQILSHDKTRQYLIKETDAIAYLIDLMRDKNKIVRKWCNYCLDLVALSDEEWASRIKVEKFRAHNCEWLDMVENHDVDAMDFEEPDDDLPQYIDSDFINNVELGPAGQRIALDLDVFNNEHKDKAEVNNVGSLEENDKKEFIPYATIDTSA